MSLLPTHWYYNTESGQLTQGNNIENLGNNLVGGAGWHELNIPGSATEAQAAAEAVKEFPKGKAPTIAGITPSRVASGAVNAVKNAVPDPLRAVGSFFGALGDASTWVRVVKVLVGGALLIIGLAHMTGIDNKVGQIARSVPVPV